jgi:hypothetical protein
MLKRLLSVITILSMCLSMLPAGVLAFEANPQSHATASHVHAVCLARDQCGCPAHTQSSLSF